MPRTRRAARGTTTDTWGSSPLSSGSASASDSDAASDSNAGSTPPPTRGRRAGTQTPAGSPATNTRRSSRLSAQTERSPAPKPAGRLTRGLRGGAKPGSGAPRGRLTTRGGLRSRRRAISSPTSDEGSVAKRARGPEKRGRPRNTGSDDSQSTDDAEESDEADESPQDIEEDAGEEKEEESSTSDGDGQADDAEDGVQSDDNISTSSELSVRSDAGSERDAKQQQEARVDGANSGESDNEGLAAGGSDSEGSQQSDSAASDAEDAVGPQQARKESRRQGRPPKTAPSSRGGRGRGRGGRGPGRPRTNPPPPPSQQPEPTPPPPPQELSDGDSSIADGMSLDGLSDIGDYSNATGAASLTRRQRAKLTQDYDEELIELPLEAKRSKFSAEEAALRKSEHARRRKFQSLQRAEQLKNDTINRLLNKQTSKGRNKVAEDSETRDGSADVADAAPGSVRYIQRCTAASHPAHIEHSLSLARDVAIDVVLPAATLKDSSPQYPPPAPTCSMTGCAQTKRYSVASLAACSLEHWRFLSAQSKAQNAE